MNIIKVIIVEVCFFRFRIDVVPKFKWASNTGKILMKCRSSAILEIVSVQKFYIMCEFFMRQHPNSISYCILLFDPFALLVASVCLESYSNYT